MPCVSEPNPSHDSLPHHSKAEEAPVDLDTIKVDAERQAEYQDYVAHLHEQHLRQTQEHVSATTQKFVEPFSHHTHEDDTPTA